MILLMFPVWSCNNGNSENVTGQEKEPGTGIAQLEFSRMEHDFGKISAGEKVGTIFTFANTGDGDLVITSASTSCGCTVPKYSKKPIAPGESGTLEVVFDSSGRAGLQTKTVTVQSNASKPVIVLKITADIETK